MNILLNELPYPDVPTLLVFQLLKSMLVREEQPSNIELISVTLLVLKLLKSRLVREEQ